MIIVLFRCLLKVMLLILYILFIVSLLTKIDLGISILLLLVLAAILIPLEFNKFEKKLLSERTDLERDIYYSEFLSKWNKHYKGNKRSRNRAIKYEYTRRMVYGVLGILVLLPYIIFAIVSIIKGGASYEYFHTKDFIMLIFIFLLLLLKKDILFTRTLNVFLEYDVVEQENKTRLKENYIETPRVFFVPYALRYYVAIISLLFSWFAILISFVVS